MSQQQQGRGNQQRSNNFSYSNNSSRSSSYNSHGDGRYQQEQSDRDGYNNNNNRRNDYYDRNDHSYNRQQGGSYGSSSSSYNNNSRNGDRDYYNRSSSSNYQNNNYNNYRRNDEGNYKNYNDDRTKPVSMKQSHHNNSSSLDSNRVVNYNNNNRKDDRRTISEQQQSSSSAMKRNLIDSSASTNVQSSVKRVKIDNSLDSIQQNQSSNDLADQKKIAEERFQQQLTNETLLLQNNDEQQVAAKREERRKRFKQMEELIFRSEVDHPEQQQSNNNNNNTISGDNTIESDDDDEETTTTTTVVEPIKEYNANDERALFIHQIEKQREKSSATIHDHAEEEEETKVMTISSSLYNDQDEKSETPIIDMFGDSPDTLAKLLLLNNTNNINNNVDNSTTTTTNSELHDDADGYYRYSIGEVINQRYKIEQFLGQGVFSCVVKAIDLNSTNIGGSCSHTTSVAIKIIRNNESMKKAGLKELDLLSKINEKDASTVGKETTAAATATSSSSNIIKMMESFTYRNHLCIVFELLEMNLRDVLKNYGKVQGHQQSVGISMQACKIYTKQLINALKYIQECNIIHADIKPDNILLDHSHQFVKLSDFGSACHVSENIITPYLVSRFYRAPEIILGMKYSYPIDMWSIACTIYELYTGKILFTSQNNNDHIRLVMELKGKFPNKVLKKCAFRENHFESGGAFLFKELDKSTRKIKVSKLYFQRNSRDLKAMLLNSMLQNHQRLENGQSSEQDLLEEKKQVMLLHDFLDRALALDPSKRLSIGDALQHPFIINNN